MPRAISFSPAIDLTWTGSRLVKTASNNSPDGVVHHVEPGGYYVTPKIAEKIKNHPGVIAGEDGLFEGYDQTWRMTTTAEEVG